MLSLRAKLGLGIGSLLLIALVLGVYGIVQVNRLGPAIDVILRENYRSVLAMQRAKEALERQDSGVLYSLLGEQEASTDLRSTYDPVVREAISTELGNITLEGEHDRAERLDSLYTTYQAALDRVLDPSRPAAQRRAFYFDRIQPLFQEVKDEANAILDMNQEHMASASAAARQKAASARQRMLAFLLGGGILALLVTTLLSRSILRPVRQVTESAEEIQKGNLDVAVPETGGKELARLARTFNAMARNLRDIRRTDRAKLLRTQEATKQAIDHLPDAVLVLSPDGDVEIANRAARTLFARRPDDTTVTEWIETLTGVSLDDVSPSYSTEPPSERLDEAVQIFTEEEEERFYVPQLIPIRSESRLLAGLILVFADVTQLRRAIEMNADLLAQVSHEISSPLTSLRMALHLVLDERHSTELTAKQTELLIAARDDAERLARLTHDLKSAAENFPTHRHLSFGPVQLKSVAQTIVERFRPAFRSEGVELLLEAKHKLPPVWGDVEGLRLVFEQLLANTLTHTPKDERVTVRLAPTDDGVTVTVADSGIVIDDGDPATVFEVFSQVPTAEDTTFTGLGLNIAQDIVHGHGSEITVGSADGDGSRFSFVLATADSDNIAEEGPGDASNEASSSSALRPDTDPHHRNRSSKQPPSSP